VVPLTGPSSLMLALMASGMNGQHFAFNGYLPVKDQERMKRIRLLDGTKPEEELEAEVRSMVDELLSEKGFDRR